MDSAPAPAVGDIPPPASPDATLAPAAAEAETPAETAEIDLPAAEDPIESVALTDSGDPEMGLSTSHADVEQTATSTEPAPAVEDIVAADQEIEPELEVAPHSEGAAQELLSPAVDDTDTQPLSDGDMGADLGTLGAAASDLAQEEPQLPETPAFAAELSDAEPVETAEPEQAQLLVEETAAEQALSEQGLSEQVLTEQPPGEQTQAEPVNAEQPEPEALVDLLVEPAMSESAQSEPELADPVMSDPAPSEQVPSESEVAEPVLAEVPSAEAAQTEEPVADPAPIPDAPEEALEAPAAALPDPEHVPGYEPEQIPEPDVTSAIEPEFDVAFDPAPEPTPEPVAEPAVEPAGAGAAAAPVKPRVVVVPDMARGVPDPVAGPLSLLAQVDRLPASSQAEAADCAEALRRFAS